LKKLWGDQWLAVLRFGEEYQYYVADEALRGMSAKEREEMETEFPRMIREMSRVPNFAALCAGSPLPDGSTYRPLDAPGLLARNLSSCSDCLRPRWLIEPLIALVGACHQ